MSTSDQPEAFVSVEQRTAGVGIRFLARLIDGIIAGIAAYFLLRIVGLGDNLSVVASVGALLVFSYFLILESAWGSTVGKRMFGLRVFDSSGGKPSMGSAALRNLFLAVSAVPFVGPVIDVILRIVIAVTISRSSTKRGIHDRWAKTQVRRVS